MNTNLRFTGLFATMTLLLSPAAAVAQAVPPPPPASPAPPAARPQDVASMDAIIAALYDVISGPAGQKRDWDAVRSAVVSRVILTVPARCRP